MTHFQRHHQSQVLRFHHICSRESDLQDAVSILFQSLRSRNYSARFLRHIKRTTLALLAPTRSCTTSSPTIQKTPQRRYHWENLPQQESPPTYTATVQLAPLITTFSVAQTRLHGLFKQNFTQAKANHIPFQNYSVISALRINPSLRGHFSQSLL